VFVRDLNGNLILSASTGAVQGSFNANRWLAPALANGVAYMLGDSTLSAIDEDGFGSPIWSVPAGTGNFVAAPIVVGDVVFEGAGSPGGHLYALDRATGATVWSTNFTASALAASNGTLVALSADASVGDPTTIVAYRSAGTITDPPSSQSS